MIASQAKTDVDLTDVKEEMMARLEVEIETNNEKFDVFGGTLVSGWISTKPGQIPLKKT
jgi:hypothetical protein